MNIEEIYVTYLRMKAESKNRGYRLPKEPSLSIEKMKQKNEKNYEKLETLWKFFNTKWSNIDLETYFKSGFELFPNFTYTNFLNDKIIKHYIQKDKVQKFHSELNKKTILKSFKFIKSYNKENYICSLKEFCNLQEEFDHIVVREYIKGNIDSYTLIYCILRKYIILSVEEKGKIQDIINKITTYKKYVLENWKLFMKFEEKLNV